MDREHKPYKVRDRLTEIRDAVNILVDQLPHTAIYIDAGAADAISVPRTIRLLRRAGVLHAQGFFVNSTHIDWTTKEVTYGQGPLVPRVRFRHRNESCATRPADRGLLARLARSAWSAPVAGDNRQP